MAAFTEPNPVRHVEMYDGQPFCDHRGADGDIGVDQRSWHDLPATLADATCLRCLSRITELGRFAQSQLSGLLNAGETDERQVAWQREQERRRDELRAGSTDRTLTLSSFDRILKERYDHDPGDEDRSER